MSRRYTRLPLLLVLMVSFEAWSLGLGEINLDSALNEPLRASITLLSATRDELDELEVTLASADTFERYGIDRPFYLQDIEFKVIRGGESGSTIRVRSNAPMTEPFLTFLVEADWPSGHLLREYTVLLDPPTYVAPTVQRAPAVTAPSRSTPSDSGRIDRQPEPRDSRPAPQPTQRASTTAPAEEPAYVPPAEQPATDSSPYGTTSGGTVDVQRGDTLWGVAARHRPDDRLTMNQTMLAIYEANRDAFSGNINALKAGARLRIPSADEVFRISRGEAFSEVKRQHDSWGSGDAYQASEPDSGPSLTLVPPDETPVDTDYDDGAGVDEPISREQEIENRIAELESADVSTQPSLIEIRDSELAVLRQELADIRGEVYEPPVDETPVDEPVDDVVADDSTADDGTQIDDLIADDGADDVVGDDDAVADTDEQAPTTDEPADAEPDASTTVVTTRPSRDEGFVDTVLGFLGGIGKWILIALALVAGAIFWFRRRDEGPEFERDRPWEALDQDELGMDDTVATQTAAISAPQAEDEDIVVVEQESGQHPILDDTVEAEASELVDATDEADDTASVSLEDTFSSQTAVNLDQTDPIAEAEFHMAYGLYDQAADLINGALENDPSDKTLMAKLCEIYFVWGNRDDFVEAATRLKMVITDDDSAEWDKIVIMGQQIAADDEMFAGAGVAGATKVVDLAFDDDSDQSSDLDIDFGDSDSSDPSNVIDFGFDEAEDAAEDPTLEKTVENTIEHSMVDFDLEPTAESPSIHDDDTAEAPSPDLEATAEATSFDADETAETPAIDADETAETPALDIGETAETSTLIAAEADATAESPTIETSYTDATSEIPALDEDAIDDGDGTDITREMAAAGTGVDETAEVPVQEVGGGDTVDQPLEGFGEGTSELPSLEEATLEAGLPDTGSPIDATAEINLDDLDLDVDGLAETELAALDDLDDTGHNEGLGDLDDLAAELDSDDEGATMLAPGFDDDSSAQIPDEAETLLAPLDDDDDFDFAKTEALPEGTYGDPPATDETLDTPAIAGTDVDLDLDDLTAALKVSEFGEMTSPPLSEDPTSEQPRVAAPDETAEFNALTDVGETVALTPDEMPPDLHDARTMTEVGTKLDLARAYVDMGDPDGARSILDEVLEEGDDGQRQQAQQILDSLPS